MKNIRIKTGKSKYFDEPDKFLSLTERIKVAVMENPSQAYGALIAIGVVIAITVVAAVMLDAKADRLNAMQAEALEYYDVVSPTPGGTPLPDEDRYRKAAEIFKKIEDDGGSEAGMMGAFYVGNSEYNLGNMDKAIEEYRGLFERDGQGMFGALAGFRLASAYMDMGDRASAAGVLGKLSENSEYMRDEALYMLGWLSELMGNQTQAGGAYSKLTSEYPKSPRAGEARDRLNRIMESEMAKQSAQPTDEATPDRE